MKNKGLCSNNEAGDLYGNSAGSYPEKSFELKKIESEGVTKRGTDALN